MKARLPATPERLVHRGAVAQREPALYEHLKGWVRVELSGRRPTGAGHPMKPMPFRQFVTPHFTDVQARHSAGA
jgi:hypothetical protein